MKGQSDLVFAEMEFDEASQREVIIPFPRKLDGTGVAFLMLKRCWAEYFGFDKLPAPEEYGVLDPTGKFRKIYVASKKGGANNMSLRIAYEWPSERKKPYMARLRIGGDPVLETVHVLTDFLNETGASWMWFTNGNGGRLSKACFHSDAVWGEGRACSG